jgi:spore germination protein GerM
LALPIVGFAQNTRIKVYLGNSEKNPQSEDCTKVFAVSREIPPTKAVAAAALQELFKGVTAEEKAKNYESLFSPESASILHKVNIKNGIAYVNLKTGITESVNSASTSCGRDMFFAQIEKTLKQFPTVKKVFFAIEGKPADFYDWIGIGACPKELGKCSGKNFK